MFRVAWRKRTAVGQTVTVHSTSWHPMIGRTREERRPDHSTDNTVDQHRRGKNGKYMSWLAHGSFFSPPVILRASRQGRKDTSGPRCKELGIRMVTANPRSFRKVTRKAAYGVYATASKGRGGGISLQEIVWTTARTIAATGRAGKGKLNTGSTRLCRAASPSKFA